MPHHEEDSNEFNGFEHNVSQNNDGDVSSKKNCQGALVKKTTNIHHYRHRSSSIVDCEPQETLSESETDKTRKRPKAERKTKRKHPKSRM